MKTLDVYEMSEENQKIWFQNKFDELQAAILPLVRARHIAIGHYGMEAYEQIHKLEACYMLLQGLAKTPPETK